MKLIQSKGFKKFILLSIFILLFISINIALADFLPLNEPSGGQPTTSGGQPTGSGSSASGGSGQLFNYFGSGSTLDSVLSKIIDYFIGVSVSVAVIIVIYGAWKMMTASGDPKKFQEGQKTVLYAAIGLLVILLARGIIGALYGIIQTL